MAEKHLPSLLIELTPNGNVSVSGPLNDKILCYGMLKLAEKAIGEYEGHKPSIVLPTAPVMPFPPKGGA